MGRRILRSEVLKFAKDLLEFNEDDDFYSKDSLLAGRGVNLAKKIIDYLEGNILDLEEEFKHKQDPGKWSPVLAVDLDGTLLEYRVPPNFGPPNEGIIKEIRKVKSAGWYIMIWTCRNDSSELRDHLSKHGIPFDFVNEYPFWPPEGSVKASAQVYLDDRALCFDGNTDGLAERILSFKPWYK
jgi:hypothetical protein